MGFPADSILAFFFSDQYNIENAPEEREVTRMYDVTALGELLIDFTCESTDATGYPTMAAHPGGGPPNFLAALSKFGAKTALIAKVSQSAAAVVFHPPLAVGRRPVTRFCRPLASKTGA